MIYIIFSSITSFAICFLFMPLFITLLQKWQIFDEGGKRKIHKGQVPSMGGIVMLVAFMFSLLAWLPTNPFFARKFLFGAIFLIALLGIRDDFVPVLPKQKLLVQIIATGIIMILTNIRIYSFHGFLGIEALPEWISYTVSFLFIIFITNAFNLIDGIDGLAGSIGFIGLFFFGAWFYFAGYPEYSIIAIALTGSILGFLCYNWYPASIFMGDTGSLVIGFVLSICSIWFINTNAVLPNENWYHLNAPLSLVLGVLFFPIFDTIRVFVLRVHQRVHPFRADKQHTHHQILRMTKDHAKATIIIISTYVAILLLIVALGKIVSDNILIPTIIIFCMLLERFINNKFYQFFKKKDERHNRFKR